MRHVILSAIDRIKLGSETYSNPTSKTNTDTSARRTWQFPLAWLTSPVIVPVQLQIPRSMLSIKLQLSWAERSRRASKVNSMLLNGHVHE